MGTVPLFSFCLSHTTSLAADLSHLRWAAQILSARTFIKLSKTPAYIFKIIYLAKWKEVFSLPD